MQLACTMSDHKGSTQKISFALAANLELKNWVLCYNINEYCMKYKQSSNKSFKSSFILSIGEA